MDTTDNNMVVVALSLLSVVLDAAVGRQREEGSAHAPPQGQGGRGLGRPGIMGRVNVGRVKSVLFYLKWIVLPGVNVGRVKHVLSCTERTRLPSAAYYACTTFVGSCDLYHFCCAHIIKSPQYVADLYVLYACISIYIYIYTHTCIIYIYIYTHTICIIYRKREKHTCIYIYICIERERGVGAACRAPPAAAPLRTYVA